MAQFTTVQLTAMLAERKAAEKATVRAAAKETKLIARWTDKCNEAGVTNIEGMSSVQLKEACTAARAAYKADHGFLAPRCE